MKKEEELREKVIDYVKSSDQNEINKYINQEKK